MPTIPQRLYWKVRRTLFGIHIVRRNRYVKQVAGKRGIEIGGPSGVFGPNSPLELYGAVQSLDNCNFSSSTVWAEQEPEFQFDPDKAPGRSYFCEGSDMAPVASAGYDFVLSSHNLEHFANPAKALKEWLRILKPGGALVLALPDRRWTFDHRREPTDVDHMMADYAGNIGEDDLTHLPEIFEKHDLSMDPGAGTPENFRERSLDNLTHRCLHHHVFDKSNTRELLERVGYRVLSLDRAEPNHLLVLAVAKS